MFRLKTDTVNRKTIVLPFQTEIQTIRSKMALFLWLNIGKLKSEYIKELSTSHSCSYWRCRNYTGAPCFITLRLYYSAQNLELDMCGMDEDSDLVSKVFGTLTTVLFTDNDIMTDEVIELYQMPDVANDPAALRFTSPVAIPPPPKPVAASSDVLTVLRQHGTPTSFSQIDTLPDNYRLSSMSYVCHTNFRCKTRSEFAETHNAVDGFLTHHVGDMFPEAKLMDIADGFPNSPLYDHCEFMNSMSNRHVSVWSLRLCNIPEEDNYDDLESTHIQVFLYKCTDYPMVEVRELRGRHSKFYHFFHLLELEFSGTGRLAAPTPEKTEEELNLEKRIRDAARR